MRAAGSAAAGRLLLSAASAEEEAGEKRYNTLHPDHRNLEKDVILKPEFTVFV